MAGSSGRQWLTIGLSAVAVAGALVGGLTLAHHTPSTRAPSLAAAVAQPARATTLPPTTEPLASSGPQSPTTSAAILYRLRQLLPAGRTSGFEAEGGTFAQLHLDRGHGPGMLRLDIGTDLPQHRTGCPASTADITTTCSPQPGGATLIVSRIPGNCVQSLVVEEDHGDGVDVQLNVATCLAYNGRTNPTSPSALTEAEAARIVEDPSWGPTMNSALVAAAAQRFPHLPSF
jgi:hypothetical protein